MRGRVCFVALAAALFAVSTLSGTAVAQKRGGILKVQHRDTPPSGSIHEEATNSTVSPYMGVFNNLIMYDQHKTQNSLETIVPDLATEWTWSDDFTRLTFKLRDGVKWHDGKPMTAKDVECTWNLLLGEEGDQALRKNPRKSWYTNLDKVTTNGDHEVSFHLKRPQPAFIGLLASGYSPVYPCHVAPKDMRTNPIGTGPFKFVELKQNEYIKFTRNDDYWKKDRPYLDGVEWTIIKSSATRALAFIAGDFDMTFNVDITIPVLKDIRSQAPQAICELRTTNVSTNLIVNRDAPPFDNSDVRTAMALTIDRQAFIDILTEGQAVMGGAMMPPPEGVWGIPGDQLGGVVGFGDIEKNREKARAIMQKLGYGPDKPLKVKVSTRNIQVYIDPAVILIDHLKQIYIDAELDAVETSNWHAKVARKDYMVGLNLTGVGVDDPDANFYENYGCGSERNYTGYCNQEIQALFDKQSAMTDQEARKKLVWEIDRKLQEDVARPIIFHNKQATCFQPHVKNFTTMENSLYNGWRLEDVWLDK